MFLYCAAEVPTELKISDEAEELEIGKLTKVGFLNAKHWSCLQCFRKEQIKGNPSLEQRDLEAQKRHRYYSNEFFRVILMNT